MEFCLEFIIYCSMFHATIWSFFVKSQFLFYTYIDSHDYDLHGLLYHPCTNRCLISTPSSYIISFPRFCFSSHVAILYTSVEAINKSFFFSYMVFEYRHNIQNQSVSMTIPTLSSFHIASSQEVDSKNSVRY